MLDASTVSTIKDIMLGALAIYGAVLSTINWRQAARREIRSVDVSLSTATPTFGADLGPPHVRITATNSGHRMVTITMMAVEIDGGARMVAMAASRIPGLGDTPLPAALSDGQSALMHLAYSDVGESLLRSGRNAKVRIRPVCEDSVGGVYRGESWEVDPDEFARM